VDELMIVLKALIIIFKEEIIIIMHENGSDLFNLETYITIMDITVIG